MKGIFLENGSYSTFASIKDSAEDNREHVEESLDEIKSGTTSSEYEISFQTRELGKYAHICGKISEVTLDITHFHIKHAHDYNEIGMKLLNNMIEDVTNRHPEVDVIMWTIEKKEFTNVHLATQCFFEVYDVHPNAFTVAYHLGGSITGARRDKLNAPY